MHERDAKVGQHVIWTGDAQTHSIWDQEQVARGEVLVTGHPGVIYDAEPDHLRVTWVGLEEEALSWGAGHSPIEGEYRGLKRIGVGEYERLKQSGWWRDRSEQR